MTDPKRYPKKLIEVALPLEAINKESVREKSIRHGHPSTLHLWWARRPLAACRAVLFSSLIDDPSEYITGVEKQKIERQRLFHLIEELVLWENINNDQVLDRAKLEIAKSISRNLGIEMPKGKKAIDQFLATKAPPLVDPFAGGGSIPLEAQRLGLRAFASDLNPVAVLINKALIEYPSLFENRQPIHLARMSNKNTPSSMFEGQNYVGAKGLADDIRFYGKWVEEESFKRIGNNYPKYKVTASILKDRSDLRDQGFIDGEELTVIAWLWARSVICPNPACGAWMPLARSFYLSKKKGKRAWVSVLTPKKPFLNKRVDFEVVIGDGEPIDSTVSRNGARCATCNSSTTLEYIREEGSKGRIETQLMAIVAKGKKGRVYFPPNSEHTNAAMKMKPTWMPDQELQGKTRVSVPLYGMNSFSDLFTNRQLTALNTFSEMIGEANTAIIEDAQNESYGGDAFQVDNESFRARTYAKAISTCLAFAVGRLANRGSTISIWNTQGEKIEQTFGRQAIPMTWDFAEANPFSNSTGSWVGQLGWIPKVIERTTPVKASTSSMHDAATSLEHTGMISTDPPYYDNINYADLSDYFYVWFRKILKDFFPDYFKTVLVPKTKEIIASPFRFEGNKEKAEKDFESKLFRAFANVSKSSVDWLPITVFYAYKQTERFAGSVAGGGSSNVSTGWEKMLLALINNNLEITGTWPIRTERDQGLKSGDNVLASSILLVCRKAPNKKEIISRKDFLHLLKMEFQSFVPIVQEANLAPVDLAQASIGPGMAIYSRYKSVLEADGSILSIRSALDLINISLEDYLSDREEEYDPDTRWALAWYEQFGLSHGKYGIAETLSKAKTSSVEGLARRGLIEARSGKVRFLPQQKYDQNNYQGGNLPSIWATSHYIIHSLENDGEQATANLIGELGKQAIPAKDLAYRLYTISEKKGWGKAAFRYNMLVKAWPMLMEKVGHEQPTQEGLI
jgi:putative DNA methylase